MKFVWMFCGLLLAVCTISLGAPIDDDLILDENVTDSEWETYKNTYNKNYSDSDEDAKRRELYTKSKKAIAEHNRKYKEGLITFTQGINHFADLTEEERQKFHQPLLRHHEE